METKNNTEKMTYRADKMTTAEEKAKTKSVQKARRKSAKRITKTQAAEVLKEVMKDQLQQQAVGMIKEKTVDRLLFQNKMYKMVIRQTLKKNQLLFQEKM